MYLSTEIKCSIPEIENGFVPGAEREYNEHEVLHFECNPKYTRTEERPSKCTKFGDRAEWSPTPVCERKINLTNVIFCYITLISTFGAVYCICDVRHFIELTNQLYVKFPNKFSHKM